ncbi:Sodium-dependent dicarboxylate transporter SdcS [Chlamydiales bacterium SCGC AG-110-P3]|nr:Sodium-dependent dicarboxylate transporter SdcS [Chlamydiales bacterium SCGC AG-110-P3]
MPSSVSKADQIRRRAGLIFGVIVFVYILLGINIEALNTVQQRTLAVLALMAVWWMTAAFHMSITALIPLVLFPLLSIDDMETVSSHYASSTIFLFMGGFMMAEALKQWGLHRRTALTIVGWIGGSPRKTLAGFMCTSAFLSMWISNTATTVMMMPMALAVIGEVKETVEGKESSQRRTFSKALALGIAYAASVGGIATLIGTPPNLILAGQLPKLLPDTPELQFGEWMLFGVPTALGFFVIVWLYLAYVVMRACNTDSISSETVREQWEALGPVTAPERWLMILISLTAITWITRPDLNLGIVTIPGWQSMLGLSMANDGTVAMFFALVMCMTPVDLVKMQFLLDWREIERIPWSVILLFGGGFALANTLQSTGLTEWLGQLLSHLQGLDPWILVLSICLITSFLTEVTSNTATTAVLLPVLAAAAVVLNIPPLMLMIPATVSASMAFMLPVATPPNAIAFASGQVSGSDMARVGLILNLLGAVWITLMTHWLAVPVFNIGR